MKLVLVVPRFPVASETFIVAKFVGLLQRGLDVHVACWQRDCAVEAAFPALAQVSDLDGRVHVWPTGADPVGLARSAAEGVAVEVAARRRGRGGGGLPLGGRALVRRLVADAFFARLAPDVLSFEFGWEALGRMHLADVLPVPVTVSFRGRDLNSFGLGDPLAFDEVWQRAAAVHLLGEDLRRRAQRRGCPPDLPHALIPPAVDTSFFAPPAPAPAQEDRREGPLRLLTVARLHWKKGYDDGLECVHRLVASGVAVRHRIVGDGPDAEAVRAAVSDLGLGDVVALVGPEDAAGVRRELADADVLLHPAVSEGFGNAVLEAQAMAVPVVCTDADGLAQNVVDGVTGFVVPRRNPAALAAAVARLAGDPALRDRLGAAGRARAVRDFSPEGQLDAFVELYTGVLAAAGRRRAT